MFSFHYQKKSSEKAIELPDEIWEKLDRVVAFHGRVYPEGVTLAALLEKMLEESLEQSKSLQDWRDEEHKAAKGSRGTKTTRQRKRTQQAPAPTSEPVVPVKPQPTPINEALTPRVAQAPASRVANAPLSPELKSAVESAVKKHASSPQET